MGTSVGGKAIHLGEVGKRMHQASVTSQRSGEAVIWCMNLLHGEHRGQLHYLRTVYLHWHFEGVYFNKQEHAFI